MSAISLADMVLSVRSLVGDLGTEREQTVRKEGLAGVINGANKLFILEYYPIVTASLKLWKNNVLLVIATDYTVDLVRGEVTLVVAPDVGDAIEGSYAFLWFPDDGFHHFIIAGAGECGITGTGVDVAAVVTAILTSTPEGLVQAVRLYAGCQYNFRRSDQSAHKFNASAGGQSQTVDSVTRNFRELAKSMCERGEKARDGFYSDFGAHDRPAAHTTRFDGVRRYQPRR